MELRFLQACPYFYTKPLCYNVARRDHLISTYQYGSQSQYVLHTVREVVIDRYQSGCCYLLSIHSQETIQHCTVYSHSSTFRWEAHFALLHQQPYIQNEQAFLHIKLIQLRMHFASGTLLSEFTEGNIFAVELDAKYFVTAHLFIININTVFEEIIR